MNDREAAEAYRIRRLGTSDERRDAEGQLRSHFLDEGLARKMAGELPQNAVEAQQLLRQITKAVSYGSRRNYNVPDGPLIEGGRTSLSMNPRDPGNEVPGTRSKKYKVNPMVLREMAGQDPTIASIIQNFKNRSNSYTEPVDGSLATIMGEAKGFDIVLRDKPPHEPLTSTEQAEKRAIIDFLMCSGDIPRFTKDGVYNHDDLERLTFAQFMAAIVQDRFVLDAIAIELQRSMNGRQLKGYYAVDGATIFRTLYRDWPYGNINKDIPPELADCAYVQVFDNQVVGGWDSNRLYYHYSNPRTDVRFNGYGVSEVEMSLKVTTGILNVLTMNNSVFDRNALPPGILYIKGQINDEAFQLWKDEWDAFRQGPGGAYGLPTLSIRDPAGGMEWIDIGKGPSDMEFSKYMSFLIAVRAAIFGVDVGELNSSPFGGQNGGLNSGKDTTAKMQESRDRGFLPWMADASRILNTILSPVLGERWRFVWRGLERHIYDDKLWEAYMQTHTIDQVRMGMYQSPPTGGIIGASLADNSAVSQMVAVAAKDGTPVGGEFGEAMEEAIEANPKLMKFFKDQKADEFKMKAAARPKPPGAAGPKKPAKKSTVKKALAALLAALEEEGDDETDDEE